MRAIDKAKQKIEELEGRIRALEARPATQIHYHYSPQPAVPCHQPLPYWHQPWIAPQPIWAGMGIGATSGGGAQMTDTFIGVTQ